MSGDRDIASVARLFGQPARAAMCVALLSGRALTATELARLAGVSKATASGHLQQLTDGGVITARTQGRHRYHRLASIDVAEVLEGLARLAPQLPVKSLRQSTTAAALATARTCYDHVAGRLGVDLYEGMLATDTIAFHHGGLVLGANHQLCRRLGIDPGGQRTGRRPLLRECLDWTERRTHLAGRLAADVLTGMLAAGWVTRTPRPRALVLTTAGRQTLTELGVLDRPESSQSQQMTTDRCSPTRFAV